MTSDTRIVTVSISIPDSTKYAPLPNVYAELKMILHDRRPAIQLGQLRMTITYTTTSSVPTQALAEAREIVPRLAEVLGMDIGSVFDIRISTLDALEAKGDHPDTPRYVGVSEAADILGITRQRLSQLYDHPGFPEPIARLRSTNIWLESEMIAYGQTRRLKPGPVPANLQ